jgi:hypothetical protein
MLPDSSENTGQLAAFAKKYKGKRTIWRSRERPAMRNGEVVPELLAYRAAVQNFFTRFSPVE